MPGLAEKHVAGIDVLVAGAQMDPMWRNLLLEVRVRDTLALPDSAIVRLSDPKGENVDRHPLQLGKDIEIKAAATGDRATSSLFKGQIVSLEPEFTPEGVVIAARALNKGHKLQRQRKVRTFQQSTASDMVSKVAREAGLTARVTSTNVTHEFFQQSAETDWEFISRLARMHDYRFYVDDNDLHFAPPAGEGAAVSLKWQDNLISFRPRVSGIQQIDTVNIRAWDPKNKAPISGSASNGRPTSQAGLQRSKVASDLGGGTTMLADRVAANTGEANELAKSALSGRADAYLEAEGTAFGNPKVKAGANVKIEGVGQQLGGTYIVSSSTHTYRGKTGYLTSFQISGRSERGLLDLVHPPERHDWNRDLVVGVVTNNNDPDEMGRVRVKYPSLSDSEESAWARIASVSAGNARGLMMLPQVEEEVIVGFEHGDTRRPIVLGSLFNGKDKPGADLLQSRDGSFALLSNEKGHIHTKKDFEIKSDQALMIEITKDATTKAQGKVAQESSQGTKLKSGTTYEIEAGSTMTLKGVSVTVEASASLTLKGATVDVQASGPLNLKGAIINIG
jgi:phage protein D/phage baseplate assembly protein gpV